jgi:hypothetical protein
MLSLKKEERNSHHFILDPIVVAMAALRRRITPVLGKARQSKHSMVALALALALLISLFLIN